MSGTQEEHENGLNLAARLLLMPPAACVVSALLVAAEQPKATCPTTTMKQMAHHATALHGYHQLPCTGVRLHCIITLCATGTWWQSSSHSPRAACCSLLSLALCQHRSELLIQHSFALQQNTHNPSGWPGTAHARSALPRLPVMVGVKLWRRRRSTSETMSLLCNSRINNHPASYTHATRACTSATAPRHATARQLSCPLKTRHCCRRAAHNNIMPQHRPRLRTQPG